MSYDPADLRLPSWLVSLLDGIIRLRLPIGKNWSLGVTRPGAIFAATASGVAAAALYSGNNLLYLCAVMLLSMGLLALMLGIDLLRSIPDLSTSMPAVSTAGNVHVVRQAVDVRSRLPAVVQGQWDGDGEAVGFVMQCAERAVLLGRLFALRRGLRRFSALYVSSSAPLGLWSLTRRIESKGWTWALVPAPAALTASFEEHRTDGSEWHDLRTYVRGDAPSRIHWRKSSDLSTSGWVVKHFAGSEAAQASNLLRVDLRSASGPAFEHLLAQAVGWMRQHARGRVVLGQRYFDLSDAGECVQAWQSLAAASPQASPVAGSGGVVLRSTGSHAV